HLVNMASIQNTFDLRNPYTSSGMINSQPGVFSQSSSQPPQSTPQPIPSESDYHSGAADYSISSFSRIPSAYPLQQLMQQSSKAATEMPFRKPAPQSDFLSDLSGFVGNGCVANSEFANSPSLQAAAALAAQHRPLYRPFNTEAPSPPQSAGRLRSPPFSSTGNLPPRSSTESEQTLGDSKSLGALLREIAGVPASTPVSTGAAATMNTLRQASVSGSGRIGDMSRYDNPSIPGFGGVSEQSLLGQQHPSEGFLDTLTSGTPGRLPPPPRSLFQSSSNGLQHHHAAGMMSPVLSPPTSHQPPPPPPPPQSHQQYFGPQPNQPQPHGAPTPPGLFQTPRIANSVQAAAAAAALALGNGSGPMATIPTSSDATNRLGPPPCFMPSSMMPNNGEEDDAPRGRKKRKPYTRYQTMVLENEYLVATYITRQKRWEISCKLHLTERQVKVWFQNRRMKSKKLQARAPNLNSTNSKHDSSGAEEGHGGGAGDGGGGSHSGCPSTVSSLDSGAPSQHPNNLQPSYNSAGAGSGGGAYPGAPPPFHFTASMKMDPSKSPGQQSDEKDSANTDFAASNNNSQLSVVNPFESSKLQPSQSVVSGTFDPSRRFDMPYPGGIHMPPPPPPFNSAASAGPPFQLPQFLQHAQPPPPPPRTRDV
ncbi:Homeobox protein HB4, partial [Taenia solium]